MKVLKQGQLPEKRIYHKTCKNCGTEFEFEQSETKSSPDQREPGLYVECPLCKHTVWV